MKIPLHKLLISSTLVTPILLSIATYGADASLSPTDSFDGAGGSTFTPKSTADANGTNYVLSGNVYINDAGKGTALTGCCFTETTGDLTFTGKGYSFSFNTVDAGSNAGAAASTTADKALTFTGFSNLSFIAAPGTTVASGKSTLSSAGALNLTDNGTILFSQNVSNEANNNGGAITTKTLSISGNTSSITFTSNSAKKLGGAIYSSAAASISGNTGQLVFMNNKGETGGGALGFEASSSITQNSSLFFSGNTATDAAGKGGAIYCEKTGETPTLTISGNKSLTFAENSSVTQGGAICAHGLDLSAAGPTLFSNNRCGNTAAGKGGAIAIADSGSLSLSANQGDITFLGNTLTSTSAPTSTRNAIYLGSSAKITNLRAAQGQSIYFYDPIASNTTGASDVLTINQPDSNSPLDYSGTIVFSGEKLSADEAKAADNFTSILKQPLALASGTLALKGNVELDVNGFTQTEGSTLLMQPGTKLKADTEAISLTKLVVDLSALEGNKSVSIETAGANKTITLTSPLVFQDSSGNFYESHTINQAFTQPLVVFTAATAASDIYIDALLTSPVQTPEPHYGYQGHWEATWADTSTAKSGTMTWVTTGYNPNPERRASVVPDSLWASFTDIRTLQQIMTSQANSIYQQRGLWASGTANFFHKDKSGTNQAFRHKSYGYIVGGSAEDFSENIFSVAFCQLFGKDKDLFIVENTSHNYLASLYLQHRAFLGGLPMPSFGSITDMLKDIPLILNAQLSYSYTKNDMDTRYTSYPEAQGSWTNNSGALELGGSLALYLPKEAPFFQGYFPFLKFQAVYSRQQNFKESGAEARAFDDGDLVNCSIPVGIRLEKISEDEKNNFEISLAYIGDVYRKNPRSRTSLMVSGASWTSLCKNLARQAFLASAGSHLTLSPHVELSGEAAYELRGSAHIYNVDCGLRYSF
ncbi:polymorphic outer membrane protein middle domain-containing protein [Chlamydia pneumoniae]|uniref:Probable outer membrane protein pmp8 n=3 Tax=Chlamydia pneumoniae TaxID=83558 RepID=PMP8_CHLPN|nr:polymorphic outer membrane protein middle domain-containing protein [Chlamydia pneumoniae]Q9Z393.1 RecName: Full=Probable outer membrane protein pmp8; AltName: Full=Outer membrane protein 11; AltName: Full=Polymorphic membrane protein 8; Flags: Precursor [Chlamydia pneumoniae]AAD18590.1 Polymorphic Outer Membrane Protein G Family [Chlamydia pneumoniae CWL029]CAB37068.1 outer membrane protein 11 [Chlamydia pneumoniae]CRI32950.1 Probable outer membrane protein pmp8 [Chlamydia pneumoniae]CRI36